MTDLPGRPPVRVEQALRLLPQLEALAPLRAILVGASRTDEAAQWASVGPYLTVGKRGIQPAELRRQLAPLMRRIQEHLSALYEAYLTALEAQQQSNPAGAVAALLQAARREESVGRLAAARAWYEVALTLSEGLPERRLEVETLRALGRLHLRQGRYAVAARAFQRSFALAEAEFDQPSAVAACQGLGEAELAQGEWTGAQAWFLRGLRMAEAAADARAIGEIERQLGVLALRQGELATAERHVRRARERFEQLADPAGLARTLNSQGMLAARLAREVDALAAYREALAWARRTGGDVSQEVAIRRNLAELHLEAGRLLQAEEEARRAEQTAIAHNLTRALVRVYSLMGKLRGRQGDQTGFVFFEQAIELCRTLDHSPAVEARVYEEYGRFKVVMGEREEARAYLDRARELFESVGGSADAERVRAEMLRITA